MVPPSLALKMGHSLKRIASIQRWLAIQAGNDDMQKNVCDFLLLYSSDWAYEISSLAFKTLENLYHNSSKRFPLAEDESKLNA